MHPARSKMYNERMDFALITCMIIIHFQIVNRVKFSNMLLGAVNMP